MPMPIAIEEFVNDLRADCNFGSKVADSFAEEFRETDIEADYNNHAGVFLMAVEWVLRHKHRSVRERLDMVHRLAKLEGYNEIDMHKFTGWN